MLTTGDVVRLYFAGSKSIDALLSGRHEAIEKQLLRAGVNPDMIKPEMEGGSLAAVQFAVSGLYPASKPEIKAGARVSIRTGVRGRIAAVNGQIRDEMKAPEDDRDLQKIALLQAELGALKQLPQTNRAAMKQFALESVYAAQRRLDELGPRGALEEAIKLASASGTGVEIRVRGDRIPIRPQVPAGDSAAVQKVHRKVQDADVDVLRSKQTGRFVSAIPDAAKLRILERAQREGFSKVAREIGVKRTTIYEWRKLQD